jgi:signal transduction histidine kinase
MNEQSVCTRCGFVGTPEARYCARCGRSLMTSRARLATATGFWFDRLPSRYVSLIAAIPIGLLIHYLLVKVGLHFSLSHLSLALITGMGSAYVGWQWDKLPSNRSRLARTLLVAIAIVILLIAVWAIDKAVAGLLVAQGQRIVSDIPGVHVEATHGSRGIRIINAPSYWLLTIIYTLLIGAVGNLAGRLYTTLRTREREVDDLRENLLAQVQDTAAQQERNRLARELHDSIKQQIFSISMSAAAADARWESDPQGARAALGDLRGVAHEAMVEMNALLQQLSPAPLEKAGLVQALRDQCEALGYRTGAQVTAEFGGLPPNDRLPAGTQESVFRIAQEAFSNIARHARAGQVTLYLGLHDDKDALMLKIQDDGQGFDLETAKGGMGLDNIRQRVITLRGDLAIESDPDKGTRLQVTVPLMKSSTLQEDTAPKQTHVLNKVCLVGITGGLALIATLFYPLYVLLPGDYIGSWMTGSQLLSLVLEIAAALIAAATGFLAARWARPDSRQTGALFGALAGGVAGITLYLGIGAAAAGLVGSGTLLRHGLVPQASENELAHLVIGTTVGIIWWSHTVFWTTLVTGIGLGAAGGLLAPDAAKPSSLSLRSAVRMMLIPGIWINTLLLIFNVMVLSLLEGTIQHSIIVHAISLDVILPPQGISLWPIGSAAVFYLVPLIALYFISRGDVGAQDRVTLDTAQATTVVFGLLSFGIVSYLLIASPGLAISLPSPLGIVIIITAAASLVLGGGYLAAFVKIRQRRRSLGFTGHSPIQQIVATAGVLWSLAMVSWGVSLPLSWGVAVGLIVAIVDVVLLVVLRRQPRHPAPNTTTLARLQLTASQMLSTSIGSALAMIAPLAPTISSWTSLLTIMARASEVLADYNAPARLPGLTMAELVRDAYLAQARLALIMLVGGVAAIGLLMLAISGIIAFTKYQVSKDDRRE